MLSVVTDFAEFAALRDEWSELWKSNPRATPFQAPEWLLPWCCYLFRGGKLWTVIERQNGRLTSLLPLFRWGAQCENLSFLGTGITDYLDGLGGPIESIPGDWKDANLEELRAESPLLALGNPEPCSVCPVITLPSTMDDLLKRIDPKLAIDIHRSSNRLNRAGKVRIERSTDLEDLFHLHRARWQERDEEGVLADDALQQFHREVATGFEKLGILRLYCLRLDERPLAVIYAFFHNQRAYAYLSGFDPQVSKLSPGTVLLAYVIEDAIWEGLEEFDFLRNPESYKYKWAATDRPTYKVRLTKPAPDPPSPDRSLIP